MLRIPAGGRLLAFFLVTALALDIALSACMLFGPGRGAGSGIQVSVQGGEAAAQAEPAESEAGRYVIIVRDQASKRVITTLIPDEDGLIRVHLVPGRYLLEVQSAGEGALLAGSAPDVEVQDGRFTAVTVRLERKQTGSAARWDAF